MGGDLESVLDQALSLQKSNQFAQAEKLYKDLLSGMPNDCKVLFGYAQLLNETNRFQQAELYLQGLVQSDPNRSDYLAAFGLSVHKRRAVIKKHTVFTTKRLRLMKTIRMH